ncbi:MAG: hypothetical protein GX591_08195 [Planctomycetes bacterium]|nr:hypothetical protein [Planctomycetota bacterium]
MSTTTTPTMMRMLGGWKADITAAADGSSKRPTFAARAYTGNPMRVAVYYRPVVLDLATLKAAEPVTVLRDHDVSQIVGQTTRVEIDVKASEVRVAGIITGDDGPAKEVLGHARNGFQWPVSVGVEVGSLEYVPLGSEATVNGMVHTGPVNIVRDGVLREISFVGVGADKAASATVSGSLKETDMERVQEQDIRAQERERIATIEAACNGLTGDTVATLKAKAINGDLSMEQLQAGLLEHVRNQRPVAPAYTGGRGGAGESPDMIEAAILLQAGCQTVAEKYFGDQVLSQAERYRDPQAIMEASLRLAHIEKPEGPQAMVRAAFSTTNMPQALGSAGQKVALEEVHNDKSSWRKYTLPVNVPDFHEAKIVRLATGGDIEQVAPTGELKHGTFGEDAGAVQVGTHGQLLTLDRQAWYNDGAGLFMQMVKNRVLAGIRAQGNLVTKTLLANANSFFSEANGNYESGADTALTVAGLSMAIATLRGQTDDDGNPLDLQPAVLVVPPELEGVARALLFSDYVEGTADGSPTGNIHKGVAELAVEPRLSAAKFTGASADAWYLFSSPANAAMVVAYLNGVQAPVVEEIGLEGNANYLGYTWRVYFDFGAALIEPRAAVKMAGK